MRVIALILCALSFAFALPKANLQEKMQENIDKALLLLQNAKEDKKAAASGIFAIFDPIFDYKLMAKLSLSKEFDKLNESQKSEFNAVFEKQLKTSFTNKLSLYTNEKITTSHLEQKNEKRIFLHSYMLIDGEKKNIVFKFYDKNGDWLIYDVDVLGVSIIQTYRSQFADLLQKEGFDSLIQKMQSSEFEQAINEDFEKASHK